MADQGFQQLDLRLDQLVVLLVLYRFGGPGHVLHKLEVGLAAVFLPPLVKIGLALPARAEVLERELLEQHAAAG